MLRTTAPLAHPLDTGEIAMRGAAPKRRSAVMLQSDRPTCSWKGRECIQAHEDHGDLPVHARKVPTCAESPSEEYPAPTVPHACRPALSRSTLALLAGPQRSQQQLVLLQASTRRQVTGRCSLAKVPRRSHPMPSIKDRALGSYLGVDDEEGERQVVIQCLVESSTRVHS